MADFFDQAQAIWKALDSMSEQDPEGYKKFISEQLNAGKEDFLKKSDAKKKGTPKSAVEAVQLEETFGKLSMLGTNRSNAASQKGSATIIKNERQSLKENKDKTVKPCCSDTATNKQLINDDVDKDKVEGKYSEKLEEDVRLLDDEIFGQRSLIERIVKSSESLNEDKDLDSVPEISKLIIPANESAPQGSRIKKGPMIEEL